jgi:serine/threonine-protein kinase
MLLNLPSARAGVESGDKSAETGDATGAEGTGKDLGAQAAQILKTRCYHCHGATFRAPTLDVLDAAVLTASRGGERFPFITPKSLETSELWRQIDAGLMPYDAEMPEDERETIRQWILEGAEFPRTSRDERPFLDDETLLSAIHEHLNDTDRQTRTFQRYFSLAHLHNNPAVTEAELRIHRAALAKAVNSLSREFGLIALKPIDKHEVVFTVDLRRTGWIEAWPKVEAAYPYAVLPNDSDLEQIYEDIDDLFGISDEVPYEGIPYIRGDWFVARATRPPLYHDLLRIPDQLADLETDLKVNRQQDFDQDQLIRGGLIESGVSSQNRLIDYHPSESGAYWISYDFDKTSGRGNLIRFPLGPKELADEDFAASAFEHAGGEVIFELPNGMHGYMLVDKDGKRINAGPIGIVSDFEEISGTPEVINGISCMGCHRLGMRDFEDAVGRDHAILDGPARNKVERLYQSDRLQEQIAASRQDYLRTLERVIGPWLKVGEDAGKSIEELPEPISAVARRYDRDLTLDEVAYELGMDSPDQLRNRLENRTLVKLGLGPLRNDGQVKRSAWDDIDVGVASVFHETARELGVGIPVIPSR